MLHSSVHATGLSVCRVVLAVALLSAPQAARAAEFHVNTTLDLRDLSTFDGECNAGPAAGGGVLCSLRAAIMEANRLGGPERHIIHVPAGIYQLTLFADLPQPG